MSILENHTKEEIADMLNFSEYQNDELLQTLYNTAIAFKIEIKDPFSTDVSYNEFLTEFKIKMNNRIKQYEELNNPQLVNQTA
tara:strand:- start:465 stop:713 length:249 start_codon:yes stop_codon:yes gene_type:complete